MTDGTRWRPFILVGCVLSVSQLALYLTAAALPLYLHDHGAAESHIGFDVGIGSGVSLALVLFTGPAINRLGSSFLLKVSAVIFLTTSIGMLVFQNEAGITLCRALQGVGTALSIPSAYTLGAALMPERPASALALLGALNSVALAVGPGVGLALYNNHGAPALFIPAICAASLGLISAGRLPKATISQRPPGGLGFDRAWLPVLFASTLLMIYFGGILAYLPLELRQAHGPNAGIFFTADALGVLLLRIPTGLLVDRYGSRVPELLGLLITVPGIAVLALPPSLITLVAAGAATGIGAGLFLTGVLGDLSSLSSTANRGTAMSLGGGTFSAGILLGSVVSGVLIGPGGFNAVLWFGAITCVAAFPFVLLSPSTA